MPNTPVTGPRSAASEWINLYHPMPRADMRLFCFPYVGGSSAIYSGWGSGWRRIEVCPIQLPGREKRLFQAPLTRMDALVAILIRQLPLDDKPFAFFGHSLGATIAFELARALRSAGRALPTYLFLSASSAPQASKAKRPRHLMPKPDVLAYLGKLGGTVEEVLQNKELMEIVLPVIRADFAIADTYRYAAEMPLDVPISAFGGTLDPEVAESQVAAWRFQTTRDFSLRMFAGGHFFIHDVADVLLREIQETLEGRG